MNGYIIRTVDAWLLVWGERVIPCRSRAQARDLKRRLQRGEPA